MRMCTIYKQRRRNTGADNNVSLKMFFGRLLSENVESNQDRYYYKRPDCGRVMVNRGRFWYNIPARERLHLQLKKS